MNQSNDACSPDPHTRTRALVDQVRAGDRERFGDLFSRIAPALYSWADLRIPAGLRTVVEPEDFVQEVWCRALLRFETYDPASSGFRPWLFVIGKNVLMEVFRGARRGRPLPEGGDDGETRAFELENVPDDCTRISERVSRNHVLKEFMDRVRKLDDGDRELLILRGYEGRTHEQVALSLGVGVEVARKRWFRLRTRLKEEGVPEGVFELAGNDDA